MVQRTLTFSERRYTWVFNEKAYKPQDIINEDDILT